MSPRRPSRPPGHRALLRPALRLALALPAGALVVAAMRPTVLAAQQVDVIRGRITGPDSAAVDGATVTATSISGNVSRSAKTDRNGRFTITFPGGDGDYMVAVSALGYGVKRFEVKRTVDQEILLADARLARVSTVLDAMRVTAARDRVSRTEAAAPDIGGTEQALTNAAAAVPADQLGDLAAMAASMPGVQLVPGADGAANGFSVLGLGADQNSTTLNGMNFGGNNLPRDAAVSSSLSTSPYDVSRGGFSGAQFSLRTRGGSNFVTRGMSLNLDAPQLQWTDPAARALGQQFTNLSLGGLVSGPIRPDRAFYNVAYQLGRRSNDYRSLLNTGPIGLQAAGIAADSASRLLSVLQQRRIPATVGGIPGDRIGDNGAVFGSIDLAPPSSARGQSFTLSFNGNWNRQRPLGSSVTELPAFGGERAGWNGGLQGRHSSYATIRGVGVLTETSLSASANRSEISPFLDLPGGRVRVNSAFDDGTTGVQTIGFGGSQGLNATQSSNSLGYLNTLSWFSANNKHRLKLTSELRRDAYAQDQRTNLLGIVRVQLARGARGRPRRVVLAAARPAQQRRQPARRGPVARRRMAEEPGLPAPVRRAPRREPLLLDAERERGGRAAVRRAERRRARPRLRQPARRLLVHAGHRAADRELRRRGARPARGDPRRRGRLPGAAGHAADQLRAREHGPAQRRAAAVLRRRRDARTRLVRLRERSRRASPRAAPTARPDRCSRTRRPPCRCSRRTSSPHAASARTCSGAARSSATASPRPWKDCTRST